MLFEAALVLDAHCRRIGGPLSLAAALLALGSTPALGSFGGRDAAPRPAVERSAAEVRLLEPPLGPHVGKLRVGAVATGAGIDKVTFVLDGRPVLAKRRPPYSVELDLGHAPLLHRLEAVAYAADGTELARDRILLNGGPHRFSVRLLEPREGRLYTGPFEAKAEVVLPLDQALDRVELYLEEELVASLDAPPFVATLPEPGGGPGYVRAVAYLGDGLSAEDLVFINSPGDVDRLKVEFVELYTTVLDRGRRPVEGLEAGDFSVLEDGDPQRVVRFERVQDRAVHLGVLIDTSESMAEELGEARRTALRFFERLLRPQDRATAILFANQPSVRVPFTNDLETLRQGLEDLRADGETTLFDSLVFSLYYFGGLRGKRAIVVLTDGRDSRSEHTLDEVIQFAVAQGVAIYPIGIDRSARDSQTEIVLQRLASDTGGSLFSISRAEELEHTYDRIEAELRSQYLLGYQSSHTDGDAFRTVEVRLGKGGLKAKTIPGYHP